MMKKNFYSLLVFAGFVVSMMSSYSLQAKANNMSFTLNCPQNYHVSCTAELWNLSIYGNATYTHGHHTYSAGAPTVTYHLNSCNSGYITRTWMVEDYNWNWLSCTQTIYVSSNGQGTPNITWPEDVDLYGCNPNIHPNNLSAPYNFPTWESSECSMLGRSYTDMLFTVNSQCKKIMRTWKVLDWCNYSPSAGYGIYTRVQVIKIINNTPPVVNCVKEIIVNSTSCKNAVVIVDPLYLDPSICGGNFNVTNDSRFATSKGRNISGTYPIGTTKVTYTIRYGCGQSAFCTTNVIVKNNNKPTPICIGQITIALMGVDTDNDGKVDNGMVEIRAKNLNHKSYGACGHNQLRFSFSKNVADVNKTFTCENIGSNKVELWVTDASGGQSFCIVDVIVQNNGANIPDCKPKPVAPVVPKYAILGNVADPADNPVVNATVKVDYLDPIVTYTSKFDTVRTLVLDSFINFSGYKLYRYTSVLKVNETKDSTLSYINKSALTNDKGNYLLDSLPFRNKKMRISASYTDAPLNNINIKDVELLSYFLDGLVTFQSYIQYLASDIDEDGDVDRDDLTALTAFVNGTATSLPGSTQWFLVDKRRIYMQAIDVLTQGAARSILLDSIGANNNVYNFLAIKKGDISINDNPFRNEDVATRSIGQVTFDLYPNPIVDVLNLEVKAPVSGDLNISFFNMMGQQFMNNTYDVSKGNNQLVIPTDELPNGVLIYKIKLGNASFSGRTIKLQH